VVAIRAEAVPVSAKISSSGFPAGLNVSVAQSIPVISGLVPALGAPTIVPMVRPPCCGFVMVCRFFPRAACQALAWFHGIGQTWPLVAASWGYILMLPKGLCDLPLAKSRECRLRRRFKASSLQPLRVA
jgi:hypothetical protein